MFISAICIPATSLFIELMPRGTRLCHPVRFKASFDQVFRRLLIHRRQMRPFASLDARLLDGRSRELVEEVDREGRTIVGLD
jgi:hypothetical protein